MMWVDRGGGGVGQLQNKRDAQENDRRVNEG